MFERLQKPFLTVETGEAYQPIRLTYTIYQKEKLVAILNQLKCCEHGHNPNNWNWLWRDECSELHFESLESFKKNSQHPVRLGTITVRDNALYLNLTSFKRACLAVPFFHKIMGEQIVKIHHADFINKVFGLDERLPHGFTELFKEEELEAIVKQRVNDYEKVQEQCEHASTAEDAFKVLADYTKVESHKRLPFAERYSFEASQATDPDVVYLGFYIFLRGRELVAIRRWFGNAAYTLADAAEETIQQVFGNMDIDILE